MQNAECRVIEFRVGDDLPGVPMPNKIPLQKNQPVGDGVAKRRERDE